MMIGVAAAVSQKVVFVLNETPYLTTYTERMQKFLCSNLKFLKIF